MNLQSPLARVRGLGSAKQGVHHWWQQRLTAVALIPLGLWFIYSLATLPSYGQGIINEWIRDPMTAVLLIMFLLCLFHHSQLGVQVVIEDYVESEWQKLAALVLVKLLTLLAALAAIISVLKIFLGA